MQIDHPSQKCENPNCNCNCNSDVEGGHAYCCGRCRTAAESTDVDAPQAAGTVTCNCGHDECMGHA